MFFLLETSCSRKAFDLATGLFFSCLNRRVESFLETFAKGLLALADFLTINHTYLRGTCLLPLVAPAPGSECLTLLLVIENSPSLWPSISGFIFMWTNS